jgi:hypothetical protein
MAMTQSKQTAGERRYVVHLRQAQAQGLTLAQYCRAQGLNAQSLYNISSRMRRRKILPDRPIVAVAAKSERAGRFVAVHVAPTASGPGGRICRLHHRSGWMMECTELPAASWLQALVQGGDHAAT